MSPHQLFEFGTYRLDAALSRLERAGTTIPLPPKAFDLLRLLAENTDRVMSKKELMEVLWPNTFVEDANLTQHIYTLRKALGDQPNGQPYIETVARRGYRLAAEVRGHSALPASPRAGTASVMSEGERKHATVLHCAISNAAAMVERLGPAAMQEVIGGLVALATEQVVPYEGIINELRTDGFIAVFGAPIAHEDDGRRAVLAALAIQRRFARVARSTDDERLELQMGVNSGPLVISRRGDPNHVEYAAIGETMKTADLLRHHAQPGTILLSESTRLAVDQWVSVGPVEVEAMAGGKAYRLVGVSRATDPGLRLARAATPLIAREGEIGLLERLLAQATAGHGQAVNIVGEPGIGKSRLVEEFTRRSHGQSTPSTVIEGRCVSYGELVPYLPIADLVRSYCGIDETASPETMRRAIDRAMAQNGLPAEAGSWLLRLIGVVDRETALETIMPEGIKARTFEAVRLLLLRGAARQPVVILVEDVHWIDRTSEEFLTALAERLVGAALLFVATHRPGYRVPWMGHSYATQITLSPLTAAESALLVDSLPCAQSLDSETARAILRRGEGNPFFLEELARTMAERVPGTDAIPDTVRRVIMARIDRLADAPKQLLQTASVLGREVPLALLRRIWNGPADFDAELVELRRLEFLYERDVGDEPSYVFKHALTQDVAYDSLLGRTRSDLHLRAARALLDLYPTRLEEMAVTLAYHFARTALVDEAVHWLLRAAAGAARVYANVEAILHLDLAARRLHRLPEGLERDRLMLETGLRQAHSLYFLGRFRESLEACLSHAARVARLNDPALTAAHSFWLAHMYSRLADPQRATECAQRAIVTAATIGDLAMVGKAHGVLALEGYWGGRPEEGIAHGMQAVDALERRPDERWWLGMAHFYLAINHLLAGDFDGALSAAARADAVGKEIGDPRLQTYADFTIGWAEATRGNHDAAVAACRRSLDRAPDRVSRVYASLFLGFALLEKGDAEQAREQLEPLVAELKAFAFPQWHALAAMLTGESLRVLGRLDEAAVLVRVGLQAAIQSSYWYAVGLGYRAAGRIARDRGACDEAHTAFQEAVGVFGRIGAAFEAGRTRRESVDAP